MKPLRDFLDKVKPNFEKGGKFEKLQSTFDAFETFLFVPNHVTKKGSHIRDAVDLKRTMSVVVLALMPALLFGIWNVGYQYYLSIGEANVGFFAQFWFGLVEVLPIIVVSYVSGLSVEFIYAQIRGHEVNEGFLVSGMLIPMIVPVTIPLWMVAVSTIFAVLIGKEVFGGTGMNVFNPALLSRAFLFFAYPSKMAGDIWVAAPEMGNKIVDGFSGATPLANAASGNVQNIPSLFDMFFGFMSGSIGETSKFAILIGAVILIITGIGSWRIIASTITGGVVMTLILNLFATNDYMKIDPLTQILMGGFLFGAVFMATDPVSGSQTNTGKIIYGLLIGMFAIIIRVLNPAYPEGMMLSILLLNAFAPLIDYFVVEANINKRLKRSLKKSN